MADGPQVDWTKAQPIGANDVDWAKAQPVAGSAPAKTVDPSLGEMGSTTGKAIGKFGSNALQGLGESALSTVGNLGGALQRVMPESLRNSSYGKDYSEGVDTLKELGQPQSAVQGGFKGVGNAAQFLVPGEAEEAGAAKLAGVMGKPLARVLTSGASTGAVNKAQGGSFGTGALMGGGMGVLGEGARSVLAPALMRTAIPGGISKETANAVLSETRGVRPSTVLQGTEGRIKEASNDLENAVNAAGPKRTLSLQPALDPVRDAYAVARRQRVPGDSDQIQSLLDFLRGEKEFGPARPPALTPAEALDVRRGYGRNFISNKEWNQVTNSPVTAAAKQGYGGITGELHEKVPGSVEPDEMIHSLKPAQQGLRKLVQQDPSIVGNISGRMAARTGALTSAAMGAAGGARSAGLPGAILGGATGLVAPEVLSAPAAKMGLARAAYSTLTPRMGSAVLTPAVENFMDYIRQRRTGDQAQ